VSVTGKLVRMGDQWNDCDTRKLKYSEDTLFQCHFVHLRSRAHTGLGLNLGLRGEKRYLFSRVP
jgi:hypothetical protein